MISTASGKNGQGIGSSGNLGLLSNDISEGNGHLFRTFAAADQDDVFIVGFHLQVTSVGGQIIFCQFAGDSDATIHLTVEVSTLGDGTLRVRRGDNNGVILATSSATDRVVQANVWHFIEIKAKLADSGGTVEVWLDGFKIINFSGDTKNAGTAAVYDTVAFGGGSSVKFDNIYILNEQGTAPANDRLGPVVVEAIRPNGNGNSSQLTGSDGNQTDNYLLVDEQGRDDLDYVQSSTADQKDTCAMGNVVTTGTVIGLIAVARAAWVTAASNLAIVTRSGGTEEDSATHTLANAFDNWVSRFPTKPGGGAWTTADVNAMELGVKVKA